MKVIHITAIIILLIAIVWKWDFLMWTLVKLGLKTFGFGPMYKVAAFLCARNQVENCKFINFGYMPLTAEDNSALSPILPQILDERIEHRNSIQLYERALSLCPKYPKFDKLDILEIGCGHGGGVEWIAKSRPEIKSVRGMDMVVVNTLDNKIFQGDATNVPLPDESVDIIVNIESSHSYNDQRAFFSHCHRILRPGGYLVWADLRDMEAHYDMKGMMKMDEIMEFTANNGFKIINKLDIAKNVVKSLSNQHEREKYINAKWESVWFTKMFSSVIKNIWARPGTLSFEQLDNGQAKYYAVCWQKV